MCSECDHDDRTWFEKLPADDQVFVAIMGGLFGLVAFIMLLAVVS